MKLTIKYYGMVAEITDKSREVFESEETISAKNLELALQKKYPKLVDVNFQLAVNQQLADAKTLLKDRDEIALLPPFAGG